MFYIFYFAFKAIFVFILAPKMNEWTADVDRRIWKAISLGLERGLIKEDDPVSVIIGIRLNCDTYWTHIITYTNIKK